MAVSIKSAGSSFEAGIPTPLFKAPLDPVILVFGETSPGTGYDVAADGRFLINVSNISTTPKASDPNTQVTPISVILNCAASLKK